MSFWQSLPSTYKGAYLMIRRSHIVDPRDNVAVLYENAGKGDSIQTPQGEIVLQEDIEFAHKVAMVDLKENEAVIKYGVEIGRMNYAVAKGTWIHSHNMSCIRGTKKETK